ncbi:DASH complex subunit spc19 [Recurvomyces mirabilis]|uniref:DASH complex subunit SPC19 n=1 Tax=Recurvomyces mirabilis TaxID=574656 RepID=A0AAE1C0Y2_9PEZI|nr:DASH complex subunit spc19 [Recurvomyces mirabilis]KAK5154151.1 DASH complex subunit spc19 [Recurvomyces mirabilis]
MQLLESSISTLDTGVSDYPRLTRVLATTRHFELVSSHDLTTAQATLVDEIKPEIEGLLGRVEGYLGKLERREKGLVAKSELLEGRLVRPRSSSGARAGVGGGKAGPGGGNGEGQGLSALEEAKLQQLRQKRERLSYAVSRLELQAGQRERQLRKRSGLGRKSRAYCGLASCRRSYHHLVILRSTLPTASSPAPHHPPSKTPPPSPPQPLPPPDQKLIRWYFWSSTTPPPYRHLPTPTHPNASPPPENQERHKRV